MPWSCSACTLENPSRQKRCGACGQRRPPPPTNTSVVQEWIHQRRRKRKRASFMKPMTVRIVLNDKEAATTDEWEPLQAVAVYRSSSPAAAAEKEDSSQNNRGDEIMEGNACCDSEPMAEQATQSLSKKDNEESSNTPPARQSQSNSSISLPASGDTNNSQQDEKIDSNVCEMMVSSAPASVERRDEEATGVSDKNDESSSLRSVDNGSSTNPETEPAVERRNPDSDEQIDSADEDHDHNASQEDCIVRSPELPSSPCRPVHDPASDLRFSQFLSQPRNSFMYSQAMTQMDESEQYMADTEADHAHEEKVSIRHERPQDTDNDDADASSRVCTTESTAMPPPTDRVPTVAPPNLMKCPVSPTASALPSAADTFRNDFGPADKGSTKAFVFQQTSCKGSRISVSQENLARATALLGGPSENHSNVRGTTDLSTVGFETAGRKRSIRVSESSMAQAKRLLSEEDSNHTNAPAVAAFQTAGKRSAIKVSSESMAKADKLFGGAGDGRLISSKSEQHDQKRRKTDESRFRGRNRQAKSVFQALGFQTAGSGQDISVSQEGMAKAAALLANGEETCVAFGAEVNDSMPTFRAAVSGGRNTVSDESCINHAAKPAFQAVGFQTAGSGKDISVSEESIAKAAALLANGDEKSLASDAKDDAMPAPRAAVGGCRTTESKKSSSNVCQAKPSFQALGFQTAGSGQDISVSEDSIAKAAALLANESLAGGSKAVTLVSEKSSSNICQAQPSFQALGFQTAGSGQGIPVSEDRIAKAAALLASGDKKSLASGPRAATTVSEKTSNFCQAKSAFQALAFQTAGSGQDISVSDDSIARAAALLDEKSSASGAEAITTVSEKSGRNGQAEPVFQALGFQTAGSGQDISVSEDSIAKAAVLFGNIDETSLASDSKDNAAPAFRAAGSGSSIVVSEGSRAKANALLKNGDAQSSNDVNGGVEPTCAAAEGSADMGSRLLADDFVVQETMHLVDGRKMKAEIPPSIQASASFETAGTRSKIAISAESLARASKLWTHEHSKGAATKRESLEAGSDKEKAPLSPSQAVFKTAGSGASIRVSDDSMAKARDVLEEKVAEQKPSVRIETEVTSGTAGTTERVEVQEEDMTTVCEFMDGEAKVCGSTDMNWSNSGCVPGTIGFQTTGTRAYVSVSEESIAKAARALAFSPDKGQQTGLASTGRASLPKWTSKESLREPTTDTLLQDNKENALTNMAGLKNPPTPLNRGTPSNGPTLIRSVAYGMTPQSQTIEGEDIFGIGGRLFQSQPTEGKSRPSLLSTDNLAISKANGNFTSAFLDNVTSTDREPEIKSEPCVRDASTETPRQQEPAAMKLAPITLSTKMKNPYSNCSSSAHKSSCVSPISLHLHHVEGKFRGKVISPSSIARAGRLLEEGAESRDTSKLDPLDKNVVSLEKKGFTWTLHGEPSHDEICPRSLAEFASRFGGMNCDVNACVRWGVSPVTIAVDSINATTVRFNPETNLPCSFFGQPRTPGCRIVGSVRDIRKELIGRGCDEKHLNDKWITNHYRWVVWKLASLERRFPSVLCNKYLMLSHVLSQLASRYETEFEEGKRSAVRKVLNRDVSSGCMLILCVSQVFSMSVRGSNAKEGPRRESIGKEEFISGYKVELTDGWYSIQACLDSHLSGFVSKGTIGIGTKLLISNAILKGAEEGVDPLDESYSPSERSCSIGLVLNANSTRLAKWDAKLGFVRPSHEMRVNRGILLVKSIRDIIPGAGNVPLIDLFVHRRYPRMFLERKGRNSDDSPCEVNNGKLILSEAEEYMKRVEHEKQKHKTIEKIWEEVKNQCEKEVDEMAPHVWLSLLKSSSPSDCYEALSASDRQAVDRWKEKRDMILQSMIQKEVEARLVDDQSLFRESTPFLRVRVMSFRTATAERKGNKACEGALLTIWNPTEEQMAHIKEGYVIRMQNLGVRATKHEGLLQLTGSAKSLIEISPLSPSHPSELVSMGYSMRSFSTIFRLHILSQQISNKTLTSSPAPEVDVAGVILKVLENGAGVGTRTHIHITDESGLILRVEIEGACPDSLSSLSFRAAENIGHPSTIAFHDIRILQFDQIEKCAVAAFVSTSSISTAKNQRLTSLQKWIDLPNGEYLLRRVSACMDVGIPMLHRPSASSSTAIGYLSGFHIPSTETGLDPTDHLWIHVDCGDDSLEMWEFPLFLIEDAARLCGDASTNVSLPPPVVEHYSTLRTLRRVFGARGRLLQFGLRKKQDHFEVRYIHRVDPGTLANVFVATREHAAKEKEEILRKQS